MVETIKPINPAIATNPAMVNLGDRHHLICSSMAEMACPRERKYDFLLESDIAHSLAFLIKTFCIRFKSQPPTPQNHILRKNIIDNLINRMLMMIKLTIQDKRTQTMYQTPRVNCSTIHLW